MDASEVHLGSVGGANIPGDNADIEYILDLFDSKELGLTICEDTEENERCSTIKMNGEGGESREDIGDGAYRSAFMDYFKYERQEAVGFVDAAIRLMNCIKKMKI